MPLKEGKQVTGKLAQSWFFPEVLQQLSMLCTGLILLTPQCAAAKPASGLCLAVAPLPITCSSSVFSAYLWTSSSFSFQRSAPQKGTSLDGNGIGCTPFKITYSYSDDVFLEECEAEYGICAYSILVAEHPVSCFSHLAEESNFKLDIWDLVWLSSSQCNQQRLVGQEIKPAFLGNKELCKNFSHKGPCMCSVTF